MKTSSTKLAIELTSVTVGMALTMSGIMWLSLLGCAITLAALLFLGDLESRRPRLVRFAYAGLLISLFSSFWQLIPAMHDEVIWRRVAPPWWFAAFIFVVWLSFVVGELSRARGQPSQWRASLRSWSIRRLRAMSPEKREKFLADFPQEIQDSYRKEI